MTNQQNDNNKKPFSIAQELLLELKNDTDTHEEKTSEPDNTETKVKTPSDDSFSDMIILVSDEDTKENSIDESVISMASEITEDVTEETAEKDIAEEDIAEEEITAEKTTPTSETAEISVSSDISETEYTEVIRPHDHALPPTKSEKRDGVRKTKIIPSDRNDTEDFIFTKYRKSSSASGANKPKKKRFRDKPFWKKLLIILAWIFGTLLGIILALVIAFFVSSCIGKKQLTNYENMNVTAPIVEGASISVSQGGRTVEYNGKSYKFNENMTTILCIGVDKYGLGTEDNIIGTGGQADALFLVAMDMESGKTDIIAIPRDIVTDIELKSASGKYIGTEKKQICLSYAYGDGKHTSCQNTQTAVERLFFNLPIQSYFAIDVEAVSFLNDEIGGVSVTMKDDYFRSLHYGVQTRHYTGETVTLDGENAIRYVRQRDVDKLESSTDRLNRQINYLKAFSSKAISMTKKDLGVPVELFNIVTNNSATDLNVAKISALAEVVAKGISAPDFKKIPGELTSDGTYAVYNVDNEKFYELFLETFYIPQS